MKNKIELVAMQPAVLIELIEQLWKEIDSLKEEICILKAENSNLKHENQKLRIENQDLRNAVARSKKFRPNQK